jgi:hypothetical protein
MDMTYPEAVRHAVRAIIEADLSLAEIRTAVMSVIPKEYHVDRPYSA